MHQHNPSERRNNPYGYESRDEYISPRRPNNGPEMRLQEPLLRAQVVNIMQEMYGPELRKIERPMFKKWYSEWMEIVPFTRQYRIPELFLFSGEEN